MLVKAMRVAYTTKHCASIESDLTNISGRDVRLDFLVTILSNSSCDVSTTRTWERKHYQNSLLLHAGFNHIQESGHLLNQKQLLKFR